MAAMNVLIVDDNQLLCWALGRAVSRKNVAHCAVGDGKSALAEVGRTFYDLVLLDIHLPDANGLHLLRKIRSVSPSTNVVMISSDASESNMQQAMAAGALRFMAKPFDISELDALVEAVRPVTACGTSQANGEAALIPARTSGSGTGGTDT